MQPSGTMLAIVIGNSSKRRPLSCSPRLRAGDFHQLSGTYQPKFIFLYCLPEDEDLSPAPSQAPMVLTTICRRCKRLPWACPSYGARATKPAPAIHPENLVSHARFLSLRQNSFMIEDFCSLEELVIYKCKYDHE